MPYEPAPLREPIVDNNNMVTPRWARWLARNLELAGGNIDISGYLGDMSGLDIGSVVGIVLSSIFSLVDIDRPTEPDVSAIYLLPERVPEVSQDVENIEPLIYNPERVPKEEIYGEIYVADGSSAQTIGTGATYTKITAFASTGLYKGCTPLQANDKITINTTGKYSVNVVLTVSVDTANTQVDFALFVDGTIAGNIKGYLEFPSANLDYMMTLCGMVEISSGVDIDVRVRHDDGGNVDVTVVNGVLNIYYIGD